MPGYMPDEPAEGFESFDEAKRYLIDEMKRDEENAESEEAAEELAALAEDLNLCSDACGFTARLSNRHYFIQRA